MNVDIHEVVAELERQFPKELTICVQAVQIRQLQEHAREHAESEGNEEAV